MFLVPELCFRPANLADRILDLTRFQMLAATQVTFIAPGLCPAVRTDTFHVPVREKPPALRAICLVHDLLVDIAVFDKFGHNCRSPVMVAGSSVMPNRSNSTSIRLKVSSKCW